MDLNDRSACADSAPPASVRTLTSSAAVGDRRSFSQLKRADLCRRHREILRRSLYGARVTDVAPEGQPRRLEGPPGVFGWHGGAQESLRAEKAERPRGKRNPPTLDPILRFALRVGRGFSCGIRVDSLLEIERNVRGSGGVSWGPDEFFAGLSSCWESVA